MAGNSETDQFGPSPRLSQATGPNKTPLPTIGPHPHEECYNMGHPNRGIALIFNHKSFDNTLNKERTGTEFDRDAMGIVLKKLGFHVEAYDDYGRQQIMDTLDVVAKMDHSTNDCLVVAVMTHGKNYGRISARDKDYTTNELTEFFSGRNCPTLVGKPKLFFIQACRGERTDEGAEVTVVTDAPAQAEQIYYTIPAMADILIMYATMEGYFAWRDPNEGAPFIQALARKLDEHHKGRDLLSILTMVNREVAIEFQSRSSYAELDKKKAMCSIVSMLTRTMFFS